MFWVLWSWLVFYRASSRAKIEPVFILIIISPLATAQCNCSQNQSTIHFVDEIDVSSVQIQHRYSAFLSGKVENAFMQGWAFCDFLKTRFRDNFQSTESSIGTLILDF